MGLSGDGPTLLQGWRSGSFLLGLTTKHLYFAGSRKRFRVRYDRIVSFDPYDDGFGIMREAQSAKRQSDHRRHAEIENAIRDLKYGVGLNHLPLGRFPRQRCMAGGAGDGPQP